MTIAIVGAGMAGLSCALSLAAAGERVTVFDKGRRAGGRVATRRAGTLRFNHGAQYATARKESFGAMLQAMAAAGAAAPWPAAGPGRWVGLPAMSGMAHYLADALTRFPGTEIRLQRHVSFLQQTVSGWRLRSLLSADALPGSVSDAGGIVDSFDIVLLALPPAQATALLRAAQHDFASALSPVVIAPCWTLMTALAASTDAPDAQRHDDGPLAWIARDSARPADISETERWVAHASPGWSRDHLEETAAEVAPQLLALLKAAIGMTETPSYLAAHRWRYALTERSLGTPSLWDADRRIGVCGDWCLDGRIEAAWDSGRSLASQVRGGRV